MTARWRQWRNLRRERALDDAYVYRISGTRDAELRERKAANLTWVRTYENGADYIESIAGVDWADAPLPFRVHWCYPQTRGWIHLSYVERCACGAIRSSTRGPWSDRNQTRDHRRRDRRDARAPKETVTCQECGQPYEAVAGSVKASERLCTSCWAGRLVKGTLP